MATLSTLLSKFAARYSKTSLRHVNSNVCTSRCYSAVQEGEQTSVSVTTDNDLIDPEERARIDQLRNVSRLPPNMYKKYHGQPPDLPYKDLHRRKLLYAQFGEASGEDPRILWPSRAQLLDQEQEEQEEGKPLSEMLAQVQAEKEAAEKEKIERRETIVKNMKQMPKWIEEYKKKQQNAQAVIKERAEKKEAMLDEARDYYGYKVQTNDPKFQKMVEEKELQEKTEKKKRKKEEKQQKLAFREQQELSQMKQTDQKS